MKNVFILLTMIVIAIIFFVGGRLSQVSDTGGQITDKISEIVEPRTLDKYSILSLSKEAMDNAEVKIIDTIEEKDEFDSYVFSMTFYPSLNTGDESKTTGMINIPSSPGKFPVIVMIRGYVDQSIYETGVGTRHAGEEFAKNGYITIAPDFLGYGGSDSESANIFETRFQTYTTAVSLIESLHNASFTKAFSDKWDGRNIFIWAHSNGGQIALTSLAITEANYPTTLWAPVTKPFPYSVLYYTDESADGGKLIRAELAKFEDVYDVDSYSFTNYLDRIKAPVQINQGTADDAVPVNWSRAFYQTFSKINPEVEYYEYPSADHNLTPGWDDAVSRDLDFFKTHTAIIDN